MSFNTPTCTESFAGAILKGAKTFSEGVLISAGRRAACDHWACRHQRAIIFQRSVLQSAHVSGSQWGGIRRNLLMDALTGGGEILKSLKDRSSFLATENRRSGLLKWQNCRKAANYLKYSAVFSCICSQRECVRSILMLFSVPLVFSYYRR